MLSFELSAIDVVLVIAVVTLLVLYLKKNTVSFPEEKYFRKITTKQTVQKRKPKDIKASYAECPRGYGNIKKLGEDNSVSERCLGCYRIMECYGEKHTPNK